MRFLVNKKVGKKRGDLATTEPRHVISNNVAFLTSVDSDEPVQPHFKFRNSK